MIYVLSVDLYLLGKQKRNHPFAMSIQIFEERTEQLS